MQAQPYKVGYISEPTEEELEQHKAQHPDDQKNLEIARVRIQEMKERDRAR